MGGESFISRDRLFSMVYLRFRFAVFARLFVSNDLASLLVSPATAKPSGAAAPPPPIFMREGEGRRPRFPTLSILAVSEKQNT